jgi:AraC-like DNA-binding protein
MGYWGEMVSGAFGRLRSDTYGDHDFRGRIEHLALGAVQLGALEASRHRVVRTAGTRGASDPGHLKLVVQRRGRCLFEQDGRRAWLRPGDWSLYDTTRSYIVSAPDPVDLHVLMLPRESVLRGVRELDELLVRRLRGSSGMGRMACGEIGRSLAAARSGVAMPGQTGERIVELVHLALLEQAGRRFEPPRRSVLRERIKLLIDERLAEPGLGAEAIARTLGIPVRTAHKAFELENCSIAQYIWDHRLGAARRELERAGCASVTDTAFACGFSSAAHFSRAFRAAYGVSPSEWRNGVRPGAPAPDYKMP